MGKLRDLILTLAVLMLAAETGAAPRDPEKQQLQIFQPSTPVPATPDKADRPLPALWWF